MSGHFANGNIKPEGGGRRPCIGPTTPHMLSVSFQLPSLQAEPASTALAPRVETLGTVLWLSAGPPGIPWVLHRAEPGSWESDLGVDFGSQCVPGWFVHSLHFFEPPLTNGHNHPSQVTERMGLGEFAKPLTQSLAQSWHTIHIC